MQFFIGNQIINPNSKPVIVYGPNITKGAAKEIAKKGATVVRDIDVLKAMVR